MYRELEYYKGYRIRIIADEDPPNPRIEFDNFGHVVAWHRNYNLGDVDFRGRHKEWYHKDQESFEEWAFTEKRQGRAKNAPSKWVLSKESDIAILLPLFLYDHGGITMRCAPFYDPWDSGQVGWTYATRQEILKEYGGKKLTKAKLQKAKELLIAEVKTYDQYLTGDVWGYVVDTYIGDAEEDGEPVDPEDYLETDDLWEEVLETGYVSGGKDDEGNIIWKTIQMGMSCWGFFGKKYCLEEAKMEVDAHIAYLEKKEAERVERIESGHYRMFELYEAMGL